MNIITLSQSSLRTFQVNADHITHWHKDGPGTKVFLVSGEVLSVSELPAKIWEKIQDERS